MPRPWQPKETQIVNAVLEALFFEQSQGRVVWANRMNSGATTYVDRYGRKRFIRFGFPGCPDIIGQLPGGKALYFEVKTEKGKATKYQQQFMDKALADGAVGGIIRSADEAIEIIRDHFKGET